MSFKKNSKKESLKREQSRIRSQRYRDRLKLNPQKLEETREKSRVRSRKRNSQEKEDRENNPEYKKVCQAMWRNYKSQTNIANMKDLNKSINSTPVNVVSQRRRRRRDKSVMIIF